MKMNYCLLAITASLLASCQKSPPTAPSALGENAATAPAATSAPTDLAGTHHGRGKIKPDKYRVCDEGSQTGHGPLGGKHLELDQWVRIKKIGKHGTKVCFYAEDCPSPGSPHGGAKVMWLAGDESMLAGESTFAHKDENGNPGSLPHFVQIYNDPSEPVDKKKCERTNILTIKFCVEDPNSGDDLDCVGTETDLGHVHVEN